MRLASPRGTTQIVSGLSLRGPSRQGSHELDEGALTSSVVDSYGLDDGKDGPAAAGRVYPARRNLWRLAEAYCPDLLAAALRARLSTADQTGRGGVRELRRALADWLAPAPRCARCAGPLDGDSAGKPCPAALQRTRLRPQGRAPAPTLCRAARGRPARIAGRAHTAIGRDGTLALFSPVQMDPTSAAMAKMLKHSKSTEGMAYDLAVDRDCRILLAATAPPAPGEPRQHPRVAAARRHFERTVNAAIKANGRLILKVQLRYFSPKGQVTRADLVQGAAMGCRRALMDFDPALGFKFSTYAANWIYQGLGEVFADRDVVAVPEWAIAVRRQVEDLGLAPGLLLSLISAVAETRGDRGACEEAAEELVEALHGLGKVDAMASIAASVAGKPEYFIRLGDVLVAVAKPASAKSDGGDDRARERVAGWVAKTLDLVIGGKVCTGGALISSLRHGAAVLVAVGSGEREDHDAEEGAGNASRPPAHLRETDDDPEAAVAEEMAAARQWSALLAALEALRRTDPEAAEVIRRRHALEDLGEGETLEAIASAPLRCTAATTPRTLCRESIRKAYERGCKALRASLGVAAGVSLFSAAPSPAAVEEWQAPVSRRPHGPFRPRRPSNVATTHAAPRAMTIAPHTAEDFGAWDATIAEAATAF